MRKSLRSPERALPRRKARTAAAVGRAHAFDAKGTARSGRAEPSQPVGHETTVARPSDRDRAIAAFLKDAELAPPAAWTGSALVHREYAPAYFQYPAMMSPAVQRDLLALILRVAPESKSVVDPFCGAGTVLSEAMYAGLDCWATDLSPLAVLLCRLKAGAYEPDVLAKRQRELLRRVAADRSRAIDTSLSNWRKWFRTRAARELSALRRGVRRIHDPEARRFFWACMAETVRVTSNSRTSTYKLHIRTRDDIELAPWPLAVFRQVSDNNIQNHRRVADRLLELKLLRRGRYSKRVEVRRQDARAGYRRTFDILMTSPPYGDNLSTVPYGQSAFLPLHWMDLRDVDDLDASPVLKTAYELDRLSLGGQRPRWKDLATLKGLRKQSPTLDALLARLSRAPRDRTTRVAGFVRDLAAALPKLVAAVRINGYLVWTIGNRRVGGAEVPLADILVELLSRNGAILAGRCTRRIPRKRMAVRNAISRTMRIEHLLVFRRVAAKAVK